MSDKKNIDRLFQEKFKDFEAMPNDAVWDNISSRIQQKKKSRRVVPLWWAIAGTAAVIAIVLTIGSGILNSNENNTINPVVNESTNNDSDTNTKPNGTEQNTSDQYINKQDAVVIENNNTLPGDNNHIANENKTDANNKLHTTDFTKKSTGNGTIASNDKSVSHQLTNTTSPNSEIDKSVATNTQDEQNRSNKSSIIVNNEIKPSAEIEKIIEENRTSDTSVAQENTSKNSSIGTSTSTKEGEEPNPQNELSSEPVKTEQTIEEAIAEANDINEKEEENPNRWSVAPNVAPVYFGSLGEGSAVGSQFNNNTTSNTINMSYGVKGSYAINNRLKIKAGINRVNLNNITNDVITLSDESIIARASATNTLGNINLNNSNNGTLMVMSRSSFSDASVPESIKTIPVGDLDQRFGFIEVPVELEYRLVDKKLGVNVIGGMSTFFLNNNEVFAIVDGENTLIGSSNNLNDTSFSANFGIGLDYGITDKMNINLEPMFKYQINTFRNTSGDFQPFFIGVYTGLSFKF